MGKNAATVEPSADALGILVLLRNALQEVEGVTEEHRAWAIGLVDMALRGLHPRPLPTWLFGYQVMNEARRREIDDYVLRQVILEENESERQLAGRRSERVRRFTPRPAGRSHIRRDRRR
jgi:hypothetical protein